MNKNSKNILLISYYFAPDSGVGAKRFSYLSGYLFDKGITPHILTIKEKYISKRDDSLISKGIIHRSAVLPHYPIRWKKINRLFNIIFGTIDPHIGWFLPGIIKGFFLLKKYSFEKVIVTGPPFSSYLIPYFLKLFFKFKLILDYRDPWVLYKNSVSEFRKKINWLVEKKILKRADLIIFNTEKVKLQYCKLGLYSNIEKKSFVIPNGYITSPDVEAKMLETNKKVIIYAGNFYGSRSLSYLLKAIDIANEKKILGAKCLAIHVFGTIHSKEMEKLKLFNIPPESIVEHKRVSFSELLKYLKGADILYLSQGKDHEYSVPYKMIDYLSVKKPILAVTSKNSATHEIIEEVNCGEAAFIDEPESLYKGLKNVLLNPDKYSFAGIEKYSFNTVANKYMNILENYL